MSEVRAVWLRVRFLGTFAFVVAAWLWYFVTDWFRLVPLGPTFWSEVGTEALETGRHLFGGVVPSWPVPVPTGGVFAVVVVRVPTWAHLGEVESVDIGVRLAYGMDHCDEVVAEEVALLNEGGRHGKLYAVELSANELAAFQAKRLEREVTVDPRDRPLRLSPKPRPEVDPPAP